MRVHRASCILHDSSCKMQCDGIRLLPHHLTQVLSCTPVPFFRQAAARRMQSGRCTWDAEICDKCKEKPHVDLIIWLPAMFFLGLVIFALMFAFVPACDKV